MAIAGVFRICSNIQHGSEVHQKTLAAHSLNLLLFRYPSESIEAFVSTLEIGQRTHAHIIAGVGDWRSILISLS